MLPDSARFRLASERAVAKVLDGDAVVIDTLTGRFYNLEGTAGAAWALLVSSRSLAETADALRGTYDTGSADVLADVTAFAAQLLAENLLVPAPIGSRPGETPATAGGAYEPPAVEVFHDMEDLLEFDPPLPAADPSVWTAGSGER